MLTYFAILALLIAIPAVAGSLIRASKGISLRVPQGLARLFCKIERLDGSELIALALTVDLSRVTIDKQPAVLGTYVLRIQFDSRHVTYRGTGAAGDAYFFSTPLATDAGVANERGMVRIAAVQTNQSAPLGVVNVARAVFVEKQYGGIEAVRVSIESVTSALEINEQGGFRKKIPIHFEGESQ